MILDIITAILSYLSSLLDRFEAWMMEPYDHPGIAF